MATSATDSDASAVPATTVFIVDDDADLRRAVATLVQSIGLAAESYGSVVEFLSHFDPQKPGCLVLDVCMPGMSGLELQSAPFADTLPPIIFLTAHGEVPLASQAIRAGAVDFIQKPFNPQLLLDRIREAIERDRQSRSKRALAEVVNDRIRQLTQRERQVMDLLARGDTTKLIAQQLSISPKTVDNHRAKILEKMKVDNCTQLAQLIALR